MKPSRHKYDIQSMLEESKRLKQLQNEMSKKDKSSWVLTCHYDSVLSFTLCVELVFIVDG